MVQDMYNPVYYLATYEVHNTITNEKIIRSGKYKDSLECAVSVILVILLNLSNNYSVIHGVQLHGYPWSKLKIAMPMATRVIKNLRVGSLIIDTGRGKQRVPGNI